MPHIKQHISERDYNEQAYELHPEGLVTKLYLQIAELQEQNQRLAETVDDYRQGWWNLKTNRAGRE